MRFFFSQEFLAFLKGAIKGWDIGARTQLTGFLVNAHCIYELLRKWANFLLIYYFRSLSPALVTGWFQTFPSAAWLVFQLLRSHFVECRRQWRGWPMAFSQYQNNVSHAYKETFNRVTSSTPTSHPNVQQIKKTTLCYDVKAILHLSLAAFPVQFFVK